MKKGNHFASSAVKNKVEGILFARKSNPNKEIKEAKKWKYPMGSGKEIFFLTIKNQINIPWRKANPALIMNRGWVSLLIFKETAEKVNFWDSNNQDNRFNITCNEPTIYKRFN